MTKRKTYFTAGTRLVFVKPAERAAMEEADRQFRENEPTCSVLHIQTAAPRCSTLGHEYSFGICLDCQQVDPAFEPTDDMIERDYLRGYDKPVAA